MKYIVGDIHGEFRAFERLLDKIKFNNKKDNLYILGGIFDRGDKPLEILTYIQTYIEDGSMILIKGNHELFCEYYIDGKLDGKKWDDFGGQITRRQVDELSLENKNKLLKFIKSLPYVVSVDTLRFGEAVLTHAGINADYYVFNNDETINVVESILKAVKKDVYNTLISVDIHILPASILHRLDKYIICGHMRTFYLRNDEESLAYITKYYMDIDCGCGHANGKLCCYNIDEDKFIYVDT